MGHLGLAEAQHEAQFALAEDRHQRVGNGPDPVAGINQGNEFPPIRQLKCNDIAVSDVELREPLGNFVDALAELTVAEPDLAAEPAVPADEGRALGANGDGSVEVIDGQAAGPKFLRRRDAGRRQPYVELHVLPPAHVLPAPRPRAP
jgi:hypothetical protein